MLVSRHPGRFSMHTKDVRISILLLMLIKKKSATTRRTLSLGVGDHEEEEVGMGIWGRVWCEILML